MVGCCVGVLLFTSLVVPLVGGGRVRSREGPICVREGPSKAFALIWYRALTWYFLGLSSSRTHFEPWKAVGMRGRGSLASQ